MEPNLNGVEIEKEVQDKITVNMCPVCHQKILPIQYFCPNCGANLHTAPLSTTPLMQVYIYSLSVILPMVLFLFIKQWPGVKYYKSKDPKAKQIGQIAWVLIILSTIFSIWMANVLTQRMIKTTLDSINADFGDL